MIFLVFSHIMILERIIGKMIKTILYKPVNDLFLLVIFYKVFVFQSWYLISQSFKLYNNIMWLLLIFV